MTSKELKKLRKETTKTLNAVKDMYNDFDATAHNKGRELYNILLRLILIIIIMFATGIFANIHDFRGVNFIFALITFVGMFLSFSHPKVLIALLKIDIANKIIPDKFDFDLEDTVTLTFLGMAKRLTLFASGWFMFLGFISIGDRLPGLFLLLSITVALIVKKNTN